MKKSPYVEVLKRGRQIKRLLDVVGRQERFNQLAASMAELFFTPLLFQTVLDAKDLPDAFLRINETWGQLFIRRLKKAAKRERAQGNQP